MKILLLFLLSFLPILVNAQDLTELVTSREEWFQGSILLSDESELKGLILYNNKTGILSYQNGTTSKSFTPRNVIAFEFYDEARNKQRLFYSIEYEDDKTSAKRPFFFELVKDYGDFALVSRIDPLEIKKQRSTSDVIFNKTTPDGLNPNLGTSNVFESSPRTIQLETVYLFDLINAKINPIAEITSENIDRVLLSDKTRVNDKVVGRKYLKEFMGDRYSQVINYANDQGIGLDNKEDLIKIFDYFFK
ncbi:MAG: hypothetical protein EBR30_18995 [Cytophagia bacterium]|nr:hypothetical protein [Cytophagia bacterium]NBW37068.1 hypothetical protein [Cytophagia bacterium]